MDRYCFTILGWLWGVCGFSQAVLSYPTPVDFNGRLLRWNIDSASGPIYYDVSGDSSGLTTLQRLIDSAAEIWSNVPSSYLQLAPAPEGTDADITIELTEALSTGGFSAGFAVFDEIDDNGPIHCKIEIVVSGATGLSSFAKTVLHELGHCVGLGHSVVGEAIMSYELDRNRFALDTDDAAAVSRLYPTITGAEPLPPGCGIAPRTLPGPVLVVFCLPLLVIALVRTLTKKV